MRLEWPVYVFTACVFLAFALGVQFLNLGTGAVVGLFLLLTVAYAWVAWIMIKQKTAYEIMPSLVGSEMCIRDSSKRMARASPASK